MALQKDRNIKRITVVGGGTSGYLTTLFLCDKYPDKHITWVFPEDNNPIGVGEAIVPDVSNFLKDLGVTTHDLMKHANGTLKLGIKFEDFNEGETFRFPFGIGDGAIDRIMDLGLIPNNMLEYDDISVHFRATEVLKYLDSHYHRFDNLTIIRDTTTLEDLEGTYDLVLDSTGFGRHLLGADPDFVSIQDKIPNNRALVYRQEYTNKDEQLVPYSTFKGMDYGWIWNIPLGDEIAFGYVHDGQYNVKDDFVNYVNSKLGIEIDTTRVLEVKMTTGRNTTHLKDNHCYIGLSSSFIEPIESTGLYLVVDALKNLKKYIDGDISEDEYNDNINNEFDLITDFVITHYKYSNRDNDYWNSYKDIDVELYNTNQLFPAEAWQHILSGFGKAKEPTYDLDTMEHIRIIKGVNYKEWYESNFK